MQDATQRFSDRVNDYIKYRPKYPGAIIRLLEERIKLTPRKIVADIGSGTGFSTELFLEYGNTTYAVEPNAAMRAACEALYGTSPHLHSIDGTAENTTLPEKSVHVIVCGQAFHWFNRDAAKKEFDRILKPGGNIVLLWNERKTGTPFLDDYDAALKTFSPDYQKVDHRQINDAIINDFLHPRNMYKEVFANEQEFDWDGLMGRLASSSYFPVSGDAHNNIVAVLRASFERNAVNGKVTILYDTIVYWC